jgi:hypothetical protein
MSHEPSLLDSLLEFVEAHNGIVKLLDAVVVAPYRTPSAWKRFDDYLDVLHRHRYAVMSFLTKNGKESPESGRQAVTALLDACGQAKQHFERTGLAYLPLSGLRDAVVTAAEPIFQAMKLHYEELREGFNQDAVKQDRVPLLDEVLSVLTAKQGRIMSYLWNKRSASYDTLRTIPKAWNGDNPSDEAITIAIKRIRTRLDKANLSVASLAICGQRVNLSRPAG